MTTRSNGSHLAIQPGSAIYVDTENLRDSDHAQTVVAQVVANWPAGRPPLSGLSLYVRADKAELWQLWAETEFPTLQVRVRGVQHFSNHRAKNSADLAITADAIADLITGLASAVAVASNDSDFGALFVKVREMAADAQEIPFLWITAPDAGALSDEIEQFIPDRYRWDLAEALAPPAPSCPADTAQTTAPPSANYADKADPTAPEGAASQSVSDEAVAEELLRQLPAGRFRAADAQLVVRRRWPRHPAVDDGSRFGQFLRNQIWPLLQKRGVTMPRKSSPVTYEIGSATAGQASARKVSPTPAPAHRPAEPTLAQLVAGVADGITDDVFKAADAQSALKTKLPEHPAASYTATQFGTWFSKQLWPIMEQHGVTIAKEKPRRYEMTPDARHNLISLA